LTSEASGEVVVPRDVVSFWRDAGEDKWFKKNDDFDRALVERFAATHAEAAAGRLDHWAETAEGALALILVLDQFSRNMFRGDPKTFAQDRKALALARKALDAGFDRAVEPALRSFFYMPFMHAETIVDQQRCVSLIHAHGSADSLKFAILHREIIRRFGRFPHRNAVLGRHTTPAEESFLDAGGFAG
jgi:uncharacterized protein (DUF924 family)